MPEQVRSLTLVEPTLFYLLALSGRISEHAEIKAIADRVIRYVGENDADGAARSFIEYWVGPGAYDTMDVRVREAVRVSIAKVPVEWPTGFEPYGATVEALSGLKMPIQLIGGSRTTPAARAVMDVLRGLWPRAAYAEIEDAGHMAPLTHAHTVNEIIDTFIGQVTGAISTTGPRSHLDEGIA
jgi:pimeloyl-ACP methyl ester carboxylesterase